MTAFVVSLSLQMSHLLPTTVSSDALNADLRAIGLRRLRMLSADAGDATPVKRLTFLAELAKLGYRVRNPGDFRDSVLQHYDETINSLVKMRGGNVPYVPLFQGFPKSVPEQGVYLLKRIMGYLGNVFGTFESGVKLNNGVTVPEWLFDTDEFGADPITQMQDLNLFEKGVVRQANRSTDRETQWVDLSISSPTELLERLQQYCQENFYAASSVQAGVRSDLTTLLDHFGGDLLDPQRVVFKETRTLLAKYFWSRGDLDRVGQLVDTPTDLLRLFAALTDSDVSLAKPIRFPKFSRRQRRFVLQSLEESASLAEDLNRYRGLWIAVAKSIHAGEYIHQHSKVDCAIGQLRRGRIETFASKVEDALQAGDIANAVSLLVTRPGLLARRLNELLGLAGLKYAAVLEAFTSVAVQVPLKNLLVMESHFRTTEDSPYRTIINKKGRIRVVKNRVTKLSDEAIEAVLKAIRGALYRKIQNEKTSWTGKRVFIDNELCNYTVPLAQREASDGLLTFGRGSRIPLQPSKVLRLFVYWKEMSMRTDLDLSLIQYDEDMMYSGHVSYTNLSGRGIVHSGDIQSAPHGAAEFIDVELDVVRKLPGCRYIAPQVYRYAGDSFANLTCHSGWMIRDQVDASYQSFDIKTVQNKFDLSGTTSFCLPIVIDLKEMTVIFVDLYVGKVEQFNRVERSTEDISLITRQMVRMVETRPNLSELAMHHVRARGGICCDSPEEADIRFGVDEGDFAASNVSRWLGEML